MRKEKNRVRILIIDLLLYWFMIEIWLSIIVYFLFICSLYVVLYFSLNNIEWREEILWCLNEFGIILFMVKKNLVEVYWIFWIDKYFFEKLDRLKGR